MVKHSELEVCKQQRKVEKKQRKTRKNKYENITRNTFKSMCRHLISKSFHHKKLSHSTKNIRKIQIEQIACSLESSHLNCPICLQLLVLPVVTECGHAYCLHCAQDAFISDSSCCVCRQQVPKQTFKISSSLMDLLKCLALNFPIEQKISYFERVQKAQTIQRKRSLNEQISKGDLIQYRKNRVWRLGKIKQIRAKQIVIENKNSSGQQQLIFDVDSRHIANYGTFLQDKRFLSKLNFSSTLYLIDDPPGFSRNRRPRNTDFAFLAQRQPQQQDPVVFELPPWDQLGFLTQNPWSLTNLQNFATTQRLNFEQIDYNQIEEILPI